MLRVAAIKGRVEGVAWSGLTVADCREGSFFFWSGSEATNHLQSFAATLWSHCIIAVHSTTTMNLNRKVLYRMVKKKLFKII